MFGSDCVLIQLLTGIDCVYKQLLPGIDCVYKQLLPDRDCVKATYFSQVSVCICDFVVLQ